MSSNKKRILTLLFAIGAVLSLGSCKNPKNGQLEITVVPESAYAIPAPGKSCKDLIDGGGTSSLAEPYVDYTRFNYQWKGDKQLIIQYIRVSFQSSFLSGGKYDCILGGDDLVATMYDVINSTSSPIVINGGDNQVYTAGCSLRCGSIPLVDPESAAFVAGTVRVFATEVDGDGNQTPVYGEDAISFQYDGSF